MGITKINQDWNPENYGGEKKRHFLQCCLYLHDSRSNICKLVINVINVILWKCSCVGSLSFNLRKWQVPICHFSLNSPCDHSVNNNLSLPVEATHGTHQHVQPACLLLLWCFDCLCHSSWIRRHFQKGLCSNVSIFACKACVFMGPAFQLRDGTWGGCRETGKRVMWPTCDMWCAKWSIKMLLEAGIQVLFSQYPPVFYEFIKRVKRSS